MTHRPCRAWALGVLGVAAALGSVACSPVGVAVGAGATAGVTALQERPVGQAFADADIKLALTDRLFKTENSLYVKVSTKVIEGRVLLAGLVANEEERTQAADIAWSVPGVRAVINETEIAGTSTLEALPGDGWIKAKLRVRLLADGEVADINYATLVVDGSVYILGIGRNPAEIGRVVDHARDISGVRRVVVHALTADDPRRLAERPASAPPPRPYDTAPSDTRRGRTLATAAGAGMETARAPVAVVETQDLAPIP